MAAPTSSDGGIVAVASESAAGIASCAQRSLDRVVSPSSRQHAYEQTIAFAAERPIIFSFIVSQLLFSFLPTLLFLAFSASTVAFALGAALVFALFWIAVAFMVLVPALLLTSSVALLVWVWAVGSFVVARWLYAYAAPAVGGDGAKQSEIVNKEK